MQCPIQCTANQTKRGCIALHSPSMKQGTAPPYNSIKPGYCHTTASPNTLLMFQVPTSTPLGYLAPYVTSDLHRISRILVSRKVYKEPNHRSKEGINLLLVKIPFLIRFPLVRIPLPLLLSQLPNTSPQHTS
jgi:hypothetical protein